MQAGSETASAAKADTCILHGDWGTERRSQLGGLFTKNCLVELYTAPPLLNADRGRKGKRDNEGLQMKWGQLCNQSAFSEKESAPLAKNPN